MNDCLCKLRCCACSSDISCSNFPFLENFVDCWRDLVCEAREAKVSKHHHWANEDRCRVCCIFACQFKSSMWHSLREKSVVRANACSWCHSNSSSDASSNVGNDASVEIRSNHHVKLRRILDKLHRTVIHNHLFVLDEREFLGSCPCALQEKTINQLHDVCLMNNSHLLPSTQMSKLKGILQ